MHDVTRSPHSSRGARAPRWSIACAGACLAALLAAADARAQAVVGPVRAFEAPRMTFGVAGGYALRTPESAGALYAHGAGWSASVGVQIQPWIAVDVRYFGFFNPRRVPAADERWFTNAGAGVVRLALPIAFVQPYVLGGIGGYVVSFSSTPVAPFADQTSPRSTVYVGVPVGGGFDVMATRHVVVGFELVWHALLGTHDARTQTAAVTDLVTGAMQFRFVL